MCLFGLFFLRLSVTSTMASVDDITVVFSDEDLTWEQQFLVGCRHRVLFRPKNEWQTTYSLDAFTVSSDNEEVLQEIERIIYAHSVKNTAGDWVDKEYPDHIVYVTILDNEIYRKELSSDPTYWTRPENADNLYMFEEASFGNFKQCLPVSRRQLARIDSKSSNKHAFGYSKRKLTNSIDWEEMCVEAKSHMNTMLARTKPRCHTYGKITRDYVRNNVPLNRNMVLMVYKVVGANYPFLCANGIDIADFIAVNSCKEFNGEYIEYRGIKFSLNPEYAIAQVTQNLVL